MKEALYWEKLEGSKLRCNLCPKFCVIGEGKRGFCYARINRAGILYSEIYNRAMAANLDPIEKKPLYHFHPGARIFSLGTRGCNQRCDFCQNWHMLESDAPLEEITAEEAVQAARDRGSIGIAYTYNEPFIWYEFLLECAALARQSGLANVLVTNGYFNPEPFAQLAPFIDAMNIDIKSMDPSFYTEICKSDLPPVLETCRTAHQLGIHVEFTNLMIPTKNDADEQIERLVDFVAGLSREIPLHFSAYYPCYKMNIEATPLATLRRAADIAGRKLDYVYLGNVRSGEEAGTLCPVCGNTLVSRSGYVAKVVGVDGKSCERCGRPVDLVL